MNKQTDIASELMQIAPDANWPADVPFTVPAGYFDQLPAAILLQIQLETLRDTPLVQQSPTIPSGYFNELPSAIMQRIKAEEAPGVQSELEVLSPFLAAMPRQFPLTVPEGYFESLQVNHQLPAAPMRVAHRNKVSTWIKWTVAACLTTLIGSSAILFITSNHTDRGRIVEKKLEAFDDQDIVEYLQTHTDPFDNDAIFASSVSVEAAPVQNQLDEAVPVEAIEKYLQQTDLSKEVLPEKK
ncbi:MAG: hypothetical protein J7623_11775 [Chitinophaga sp.]|uniref:hypothetical protein n=1 Tax=Chitinophaga sp. TaxID=1869181 RepID=UPI001AFE6F2A|nr:hypothetical protein [Chitinophaga sp.]MBO9729306.1 hypothetical protein [Chitinophaga sp.]